MVVTVLLALADCALVLRAVTAPGKPPQPSAAAAISAPPSAENSLLILRRRSTPTPGARQEQDSFGQILEPSPPVTLAIPSIGVRTRGIVDLRLDRHASSRRQRTSSCGWYADGPTPGESSGPPSSGRTWTASTGRPSSFGWGSLHKGAVVNVGRKDGSKPVSWSTEWPDTQEGLPDRHGLRRHQRPRRTSAESRAAAHSTELQATTSTTSWRTPTSQAETASTTRRVAGP